MGGGTATYQPHGQAGTASGDESIGQGIAQAGQHLGRAAAAMDDQTDRQNKMADLALENASLKNKMLKAQITTVSKPTNPPLPSHSSMPLLTGQGDSYPTTPASGYVIESPLYRTHSAHGKPSQETGKVPDVGWTTTPTGLAPVPSTDVKQKIEDQLIPEIMWAIRNQLMPNVGHGNPPSKKLLPKGADHWRWNHMRQEYTPAQSKSVFKRPYKR